MSVKTASVFTCDKCRFTEHGLEDAYEVPLDWLTIRISKNVSAATANDIHICPTCKYDDVITLWETI
jgi:ribosomal protein L37AE/L43A